MMPYFENFKVSDTVYSVRDGEALHTDDAPNDGQQYARKNKAWAVVQGGGGSMKLKIAGESQTPDEDGYVDIPQASANTIGVIATSTGDGFTVSSSGRLRAYTRTAANYTSASDGLNISKGTLENIKTDLVNRAMLGNVKTAMDSVAVAGAQYYLGVQTAVNIVLPSNATAGQQITVVWYNGATAATLSITGTVLTTDYTPSANSRSEINALWDGTYWAVVTNEQAVPEVTA